MTQRHLVVYEHRAVRSHKVLEGARSGRETGLKARVQVPCT